MQEEIVVSRTAAGPASEDASRGNVLDAALTLPLHQAISLLCDTVDLDERVDAHPDWSQRLLSRVRSELGKALGQRDEQALEEVHGALFALYDLHTCDGTEPRAINQFNPTLTQVRRHIERAWLDSEGRRLAVAAPAAPDGRSIVEAIKRMWSQHAVVSHRLFDFLEKEASREQIVAFFRSDSALNLRFFDLLLYAMIGARSEARTELAQNLWDEAGRGDAAQSHVNLFQHLLNVVGVGPADDNHASVLGWEGLAGHNQFMLACVNRAHYFKLLGVMAITELLDPAQYEKLVNGCKRVGLGSESELSYYDEHITIDVVHGDGWLTNVITPIVDQSPAIAGDILFGAAWRLSSCDAYYSALHARLLALPMLHGQAA